MNVDDLGDRMKEYEERETGRRFMPFIPIYARIDGRGFSKFTRGMERPYDKIMSHLMIATVAGLVEQTNARIGYTQSDEISLVWLTEDPKGNLFFAGKTQKTTSILASLATAIFIRALLASPYAEKVTQLPHFDARAFNLPNKAEAANAFLWRELDATKNAVSMAARAYYPAKELQGKKSAEMQEMLFARGINFNDYPAFFKRGTYVRKVIRERTLLEEERNKIPEQHRPAANVTFLRSSVEAIEMPRLSKIANREEVIFDGAVPELFEDNANQRTA